MSEPSSTNEPTSTDEETTPAPASASKVTPAGERKVAQAAGDTDGADPVDSDGAVATETDAKADDKAARKAARKDAGKPGRKPKKAKAAKKQKPPKKPRTTSRPWVAPLMLGCWLLGLIWLVVFYVAGDQIPVMSDLGNWNLLIGMGLIALGFIVSTQWI